MRTRSTEKGDVMAVIFGVLVVALMAALGFIFYQNFLAKDEQKTEQPQVQVADDSKQTARLAFDSKIYEIDHPKDWLAVTSENTKDKARGSTIAISSPSQAVRVTFTVAETGFATGCDQNSPLKISSYVVKNDVNTKLTGQSLALVESMIDVDGGGYQYKIGLTQDSGATHAAVGDAYCNVIDVGFASTLKYAADGKTVQEPVVIAKIDFPKLPVAPKPASKDMQGIKDLMATDDYKKAVSAIQSAREE